VNKILILIITLIIAFQAISPLYSASEEIPFTQEVSKDYVEYEIEELSEVEVEKICLQQIILYFISEDSAISTFPSNKMVLQYYKDLYYPPPEQI